MGVVEDEIEEGVDGGSGEECDREGKRRPSPILAKTELKSEKARVKERSLGVEHVDDDEEPMKKKRIRSNC